MLVHYFGSPEGRCRVGVGHHTANEMLSPDKALARFALLWCKSVDGFYGGDEEAAAPWKCLQNLHVHFCGESFTCVFHRYVFHLED